MPWRREVGIRLISIFTRFWKGPCQILIQACVEAAKLKSGRWKSDITWASNSDFHPSIPGVSRLFDMKKNQTSFRANGFLRFRLLISKRQETLETRLDFSLQPQRQVKKRQEALGTNLGKSKIGYALAFFIFSY